MPATEILDNPKNLPKEAGIGHTPHSAAKAASERRRSGLMPAETRRVAAVSGPAPTMLARVGDKVPMNSHSPEIADCVVLRNVDPLQTNHHS